MKYIHKQDDEHDQKVAKRYVMRTFLSQWVLWLIQPVKIYYGLKWLCKRTRNRYLAYYRLTMTYAIANVMYFSGMIIIFLALGNYVLLTLELVATSYAVITGVCVELHMRYIDRIHYARVDLLRDK